MEEGSRGGEEEAAAAVGTVADAATSAVADAVVVPGPNDDGRRHVVNLKNHTCTCREWQVSGKPCQHALALIITYRNPKMEDYLDPYYSVYHFRLAYGGVIRPLTDKSQWAKVDIGFKLRPPLAKRPVGRQRKNRIPSCLESKGSKPWTKGMWLVQCQRCLGRGHRMTSPQMLSQWYKKRGRVVPL